MSRMLKVLLAYEEWEADLVMCNASWRGSTPTLTQDQWDRLLEIQEQRNEAVQGHRGRRTAVLIGSSRFKADFHRLGERLEKEGALVLMMAFFQHADGRVVSPHDREVLRGVDRRRLDMATEVWVVNPAVPCCPACGKPTTLITDDWAYCRDGGCDKGMHPDQTVRKPYVGEDTKHEIEYAQTLGVRLHCLNPMEGA